MRIKKILVPFLFISTLLTLMFRTAAKSSTAKSSSKNNEYDAIDAYIMKQMHQLKIPGASLAIVEGNQIVHMRGYGQARPQGESPTPQTPFFIGSLTKSFTALAIMQLVEAGKVNLDTPVQYYLPWFQVADPLASAQITVRHLLNQTSGFSEAAGRIPLSNFDNSPNATERQARILAKQALKHPVGTACEYSNANYNLLGLIIEAGSGETYANYIQNHIFSPLDMKQSYFSPAEAKQNGLAIGHQYWFGSPSPAPDIPVPRGSLPSGQLIASAEDMAHYLIAQLNEGRYCSAQILSPAGINEMHNGVAEYTQLGLSFGKYGMGWFIDELNDTKIVWHTGIVPNFFSYMALLPEQNKGVILLMNSYHYFLTPGQTEIGAGVAALLSGQKPSPSQARLIPWLMRSQLLLPIIQIVEVIISLKLLRRWQQNPLSHPNNKRKWGLHILPSLVMNLLLMLMLLPVLGPIRGFWRLYMPDFSRLALICGGFAGIWSTLRTGWILYILRKRRFSIID